MTEKKPEKAGRNQAGQFKPGRSGNPKGKPKGARHKSTMAALSLLEGDIEGITRKCIEVALTGDLTAIKICLDKLIPAAKDRPVNIALPVVNNASDLPLMTSALLAAASTGEIGTTEAATLARIVDAHRASIEINDLTARIEKLESEVKK